MTTYQLLVNSPTGKQELVEIEESGSYFDPNLVLWDERTDGPLSDVTLGKMQRDESGQLITLLDYLPEHSAAIRAESVPAEIPMPYALEVLDNLGLHAQIDSYINTLGVAEKSYWQRSMVVHRNNPLVEKVRAQMAWTQDYVDDLFIAAEELRKNF